MRRSLRYRLPNPPAVFLGREAELDWLERRLSDGPLAIVAGPEGVGKTALAHHALTRLGVAKTTVSISVRPDDPSESLLRHLLFGLGELHGRTVDAVPVAQDAAEGLEAALELAESADAYVFVDDLHHSANPEECLDLLVQVANFARKSRWLVTRAELPRHPSLSGRGFVLGSMSEADLLALGQALGPHTDPTIDRAAARLSSGSVWLFLQLRSRGIADIDPSREGLLASLGEGGRRLLGALSALRYSLDEETLLSSTSSDSDVLEELRARGMVVPSEGGFRAHDAVRGLVPIEDSDALELAEKLARAGTAPALTEGLRLFLERGAIDGARRLLDGHGESLLAQGHAPRVWSVLGRTVRPELELWRMRCAAELGNATVLAAARPRNAAPAALEWADMLRLMGDPIEALHVTDAMEPSLERVTLRARCTLALGRSDEAIDLLESANHGGPLLELANAIAGRPSLGLDSGEGVRDTLDLSRAAWWRGQRERAEHLVGLVASSPRGAELSLMTSREALLLEARLDLEAGRLEDAERRLGELRPYVRGPSTLRPEWSALEAELRLARGPMRGLEHDLAEAIEISEESDVAARAWLELSQRRLSSLSGRSSSRMSSVAPGWRYDAAERLDAARRAIEADAAGAAQEARAVARDAAEAKLPLVECDALAIECEARLTTGDAIEPVAEALRERASAIGAKRHLTLADYALGFAEPAAVERAATRADVAPRTARWARAQLGHPSVLDAIDRRVVGLCAMTWPGSMHTLHPEAESNDWEPGWGIADEDMHAWLPDGRRIELGRRPLLYRFLSALFARDGRASKEQLILDAWEDETYHPGRHDPKLFVAVRALRQLIEDDPKAPTRIVTTEEGYALARPFRRLAMS